MTKLALILSMLITAALAYVLHRLRRQVPALLAAASAIALAQAISSGSARRTP